MTAELILGLIFEGLKRHITSTLILPGTLAAGKGTSSDLSFRAAGENPLLKAPVLLIMLPATF